MAATAFACVALLPVVGATPTLAQSLVGFAQPVPYFLYAVLVLGLAAGKSGLADVDPRETDAIGAGRVSIERGETLDEEVAELGRIARRAVE